MKKFLALIFVAFILYAQTQVIPSSSGGGGAPTDASYLLLGTNGSLSAERVFTCGSLLSCTDGGAGSTYTVNPDSAKLQTLASDQSGAARLCSGSASSTATCSMTPTLTAYGTGMTVEFIPGASNTTTYTLNIDSLGAKNILTCDAGALMANDIVSGRQIKLTYDGTQFRMPCTQQIDVLDFNTFVMREDFCGANNSGGGLWFGKYGWATGSIGTSTITLTRDANDPCILQGQTGASSGNLFRVQFTGKDSNFNTSTPNINPTSDTFHTKFAVRFDSVANITLAFGWCRINAGFSDCSQQGTNLASGLWIKFSTADSDTNFEAVSCASAGCTATVTDLGVAPAANTTYAIELKADVAGTVQTRINGGSWTSVGVTSLANTDIEPFFIVKTATTAAKTLQIREWATIWTGRTN